MKKNLVKIFICLITTLMITGCNKKTKILKLNEDFVLKPISNEQLGETLVFSVTSSEKSCIPIELDVYANGTYELFTAYETCPLNDVCHLNLKYTRSIKGTYKYDISKIIKKSNDDINNLLKYEINMGSFYVKNGYDIVEDKYLDEFLRQIDVDLNVCADKDYTWYEK